MLFTTPEERTEMFRMADRDPTSIPFGSAMSYACSTKLGIWGNEAALRQDCARLMLYEIKHELQTTHRPELANINVEDVLRSAVFAAVFDQARVVPNIQLKEDLTKRSGRVDWPIPIAAVKPDLEYALDQRLVHRLVIADLTKHRMCLPRQRHMVDW